MISKFLQRVYLAGVLLWGSVIPAMAADAAASQRLDRENLLVYRDAKGALQPVKGVGDWGKRRAMILEGMQEVMGPLPGPSQRTALNMEILEEVDCGSYIRYLISYSPEPKAVIPAYLLVPREALESGKKFPAVLCLHPTDNELGHKVVVGLGGKANRAYGRELAERRFVVLAPAYPLLANYQPNLKALGYQSGSMKAIWDNIRGLDLLDSLPYVQAGKYGVIGHSLGGHNAIFTAAFDERIQAVITSCGFDSFRDYMNGNIHGWTSERYMPGLLEYSLEEIPFDFHELIGALAPRHVFVSAPFYDHNFQWRSVHQIERAAAAVYRLYQAPRRLRVEHPRSGHDFPEETRLQAYEMLDEVLR
jgi:hypothetical protein